MQTGARISASIELLEHIHASWEESSRQPVDRILAEFYKNRRYMGSKDRAFVSSLTYACLRHGGALQWWAEQSELEEISARQIVFLALLMVEEFGFEPAKIADLCDGRFYAPKPLIQEERDMLNECCDRHLESSHMPGWARYNMQDWLLTLLKKTFGNEFEEEIAALNEEAPVDLRVNTLQCPDRADVIMALDRLGYYGTHTPLSPLGVRLKKRLPVFTLEPYKKGWFELQDEGSQIVTQLVDAKPGQKVIDYCAGAGGKTLGLAADMDNKGTLFAWDTNERRLKQIHKRLSRAGATNVITEVIDVNNAELIKKHRLSADRVLVDAPCSGSGTWRRNPDLKWCFSLKDLKHTIELQARILSDAAQLLTPGGLLVYATCSLIREENEQQIKRFLGEHPDFRVESVPEMWNKHKISVSDVGECLRLSPYRSQTDGFFAAILKRI